LYSITDQQMNTKHGWNDNYEKTEVLRVKPVPLILCLQQFPHGLNHVMACTLFHLCTAPALTFTQTVLLFRCSIWWNWPSI